MTRTILVIDGDEGFASGLLPAARDRGIELLVASTAAAARTMLSQIHTDAVLLGDPGDTTGRWPFLAELRSMHRQLPVIVCGPAGEAGDRMEVARLGARGFIERTAAPAAIVEQIRATLAVGGAELATVLMVDDDPLIHAMVRSLLEREGLRVIAIDDPQQLWSSLEQVAPDLLMLDFDMPGVTGADLCRMVRNDANWSSLPVLFLTGRAEPTTVVDVFEAGADDYVAKPVIGPELVARVRNRLERSRLQRWTADVDELTGIANRRRANRELDRLFRMASRYEVPLTLGVLDLDNFKAINFQYGHPGGDAVLRRFGALVTTHFRDEDVVARWGGEEFLIAMYGATLDAGARRVRALLDAFREEQFGVNEVFEPFHVTFSGGVADFPRAGRDFATVFQAADDALARAKAQGRNRVVAGAS